MIKAIGLLTRLAIGLPSAVWVTALWITPLWVNSASADGLLEVDYAYYQHDNMFEAAHATLETQLSYEHTWQLADTNTLLIKPRLALDKGDLFTGNATLNEKSTRRSKLGIDELVLTQYINNFELSVGKQVFSWGLGDMYNPSDHLNAVDTLLPVGNIKLGQWSASLLYLGASFNLNLIFIPRLSPSRLPQQNNRWFRSVAAIQTAAQAQLGFIPDISLARQIDHHSATAGAQITSGQWLPGWDIEFSYLHSQDATGVYLPQLNGTLLDLIRVFPKFDEASFGLSTAVGKYTFHGITSYHNTENNQQDDDYLTFLVGTRRSFYIAGSDDEPETDSDEDAVNIEEVTLSLEYVKEKISHHRDPNSAYVNSGFGRTLTNSMLINLELKFSEDTLLTLGLIKNFDQQDRYVSMAFSHQLSDDFKVSIGLDLLSGTSDSLFGQWSANDRIFLSTRYNF
jgi:hypothetical protein